MSDTLTDWDLYKYASTAVAQRINILPGVSQVNIYGVQGAIRIKADPSALAARGLTMDDLASGIKSGTVYSGAGQFDGAHRTFVLQPNGQIDKAEDYRELIVARNPNGLPVYLRDVADVRQSVQDERISRFFWVRGFKPPGSVVVLAVSRQAGANAVEVARSVKALFPELRASLPGSIQFTPVFDRSQTIVNSADEVKWTLIIAFVLVVAGHLRFSWTCDRHADSGCGAADVIAAHRGRDVHAQFFHQQSHVDGSDAGHRLPCR